MSWLSEPICTCPQDDTSPPPPCRCFYQAPVVVPVYTFTPYVAWECPRCKAMNAPTTERCNCKPAVTL